MTKTKAEGYYPLVLVDPEKGERTLLLYYTTRSLAYLEDALGVPLSDVQGVLSTGRVRHLGLILMAGLLHYDYDWTVDDVMGMVPIKRLQAVSSEVMAAFNESMGGEEEAPKDTKKKTS